jgi:Flp pilus assembly protein TadG
MYNWGMGKKSIKALDQSGAIAVIVGVALITFCGFLALVVDVGHMVLVKAELQNTADAGAIAGAQALPDWSQGQTKATTIVQLSKVDGQLLTSCQVQPGYWSTTNHIFQPTSITPQATDAPAIQVTVAKTADQNGGSVQMYFAPIIGAASTRDLSATSVAIGKLGGVWSILETGNSSITLNSNITANGNVGDNGSSLIFNSGVVVQGKVYLKTKTSLTNNGGVAKGVIEQDSGSNTILAQAVSAANAQYTNFTGLSNNSGTFANINSNKTISGTTTVNVADVTNLLLNSNQTLTLNGTSAMSFVVRVSGTFILNSNSNVSLSGGLKAGNVTFVATGASGVIINSNCTMNGSILTQKSSVTLNSNATLNGSIVGGQSISLNSNSVVTPPKTFMPSIGGGQRSALVN